MINASTYEKLRALNCSAMADEFQNQINDSKSYNLLAVSYTHLFTLEGFMKKEKGFVSFGIKFSHL